MIGCATSTWYTFGLLQSTESQITFAAYSGVRMRGGFGFSHLFKTSSS
jgi:hypothetical protein